MNGNKITCFDLISAAECDKHHSTETSTHYIIHYPDEYYNM